MARKNADSGAISFQFRGADETIRRLADASPIAARELRIGMEESLDELKKDISPHIPVGATGKLKRSFYSRITGNGSNIVGHYGSNLKPIFGTVAERGRKTSSKTPPSEQFGAWVQRVLGISDIKEIKSTAFLIARSVARKGVKGKHFMAAGLRMARPKIMNNMKRAVKRIEDLINGH